MASDTPLVPATETAAPEPEILTLRNAASIDELRNRTTGSYGCAFTKSMKARSGEGRCRRPA